MKKLVIAVLISTFGLSAQAVTNRSSVEKRLFQKATICPSSGVAGVQSCKGHVMDHIIPLCAGGADRAYNMMYQTKAASMLKDKDEIRICAAMRKCAAPTKSAT